MKAKQEIGRLALRVEGEFWNAYYAESDTMRDALILGSLHMAAAEIPARKAQFMELMKEVVADIIEDAVGARPEWSKERAAPEHERDAGRVRIGAGMMRY